jgi:murein DD-endopeptidase MepM/ murein hydrolase activator NlpD
MTLGPSVKTELPPTIYARTELNNGLKFDMPPVPFRDIVITDPVRVREIHPVTGDKRLHQAIDVRAPKGTLQLTVLPGRIGQVGFLNDACGYGVTILHTFKGVLYRTQYCHLDPGPVFTANGQQYSPKVGDRVNAGQAIGKSGNTGTQTSPHQHFIFARLAKKVDIYSTLSDNELISLATSRVQYYIDSELFLVDLVNRGVIQSVTRKDGTAVGAPPRSSTRTDTSATVDTGTVSPYIGSLESFHPAIQYGLTRRRISSETANSVMPFVKMTSLTNILPSNLTDDTRAAWCPTLGVHGENSVSFEQIYTPKNNKSIIAYATTQTQTGEYNRVPVTVADTSADPKHIPIPGIVDMTVERSTAGPMGVRGGLMRGEIKIKAYSVGQVDALLRYFLRPATRVVLEFGSMSTAPSSQIRPFNWNQSAGDLKTLFTTLISDQKKQREFIQEYVYNNYGNYEIYIAYVVKFNLKVNKDNIYDIGLTVHSVQQFELPTKHTGVKALCPDAVNPCQVSDVREYFSEASSNKTNSFSNLIKTVLDNDADSWRSHIVPIGTQTDATSITDYYVSWRFFVEKILNDETSGIISVVSDEKVRSLLKLGLLRPVQAPTNVEVAAGNTTRELVANEVGYHPGLRSTNLDVMIIYNAAAQLARTEDEKLAFISVATRASPELAKALESNSDAKYTQLLDSPVGTFRNRRSETEANQSAIGYLTDGIWLNTAAIKRVFAQADTVSLALNALLTEMNNATEGYWNLQLYSSDRPNPGMYVIDMALAKAPPDSVSQEEGKLLIDPGPRGIEKDQLLTNPLTSYLTIDRFYKSATEKDRPKYVYKFNRGHEIFTDGELGSDIIDMNVEFNLPQVIAVQAIAGVGGSAQKSTLQSIDIPELNRISLIDNLIATCEPANVCTGQACPPTGDEAYNLRLVRERIQELRAREKFIKQTASNRSGTGNIYQLATVERSFAELLVEERQAVEAYNKIIREQLIFPDINGVVSRLKEVSQLGKLLELIEFNPAGMMKKLNIDSTNTEEGRTTPYAHSFNSSNLTKTVVSVTLPGLGGVELFQSFVVDRVPSIITRGFYVVTKVVHKFSTDRGWITTIDGRFRFLPTPPSLQVGQRGAGRQYDRDCETPAVVYERERGRYQ